MRNIKKEYKAPVAEVTEFECADVITVSETYNLWIESNEYDVYPGNEYVNAGSKRWSDIYEYNPHEDSTK